MSAPSMGPDGVTPVDRRWFEEALRSQGFVVEPPAGDIEPDPEPAALVGTDEAPTTPDAPAETATNAELPPAGEPPTGAASVERPPMPSALLARIAARGQAAPVVGPATGPETSLEPAVVAQERAEPEDPLAPELVAGPERVPADEPETVPAASASGMPDAERPAPWASAVEAPVAPWSSPALDPPPATEPPGETRIDEAASVMVAASVGAPAGEPAGADGPGKPPESALEAIRATPISEPSRPAPPASLQSPYAEGSAVISATGSQAVTVMPPAAPGPEASEGELWALVGASESTTTPASRSDATRIVLTILTAFIILALVVGSLVLVGQIA